MSDIESSADFKGWLEEVPHPTLSDYEVVVQASFTMRVMASSMHSAEQYAMQVTDVSNPEWHAEAEFIDDYTWKEVLYDRPHLLDEAKAIYLSETANDDDDEDDE